MVRAVRDGAVTMANPFRCKVLHKKASFAVLSDERNAGLFTADERALIAAHIPWTRVVEDRCHHAWGARGGPPALPGGPPRPAGPQAQRRLRRRRDRPGWEVDDARGRCGARALERPTSCSGGSASRRGVPELVGREGGVRRPDRRHRPLRVRRRFRRRLPDPGLDRHARQRHRRRRLHHPNLRRRASSTPDLHRISP